MCKKKTNIRQLLPNAAWLELSRLRPAWGPWAATVFATSGFLEQLITPLENLSPSVRCSSAAMLFAALGRVVSEMPGVGCMEEPFAELLLLELVAGEERFDILIGLRRCETGDWYLSAAGDWRGEGVE